MKATRWPMLGWRVVQRPVARWLACIACASTFLGIAGCERASEPAVPDAAVVEQAAALEPADERLAGLYRQSCRACHSLGAAGAPLTGSRAAWDERWSKGLAALRSSTINGMNGMPPGGQCFACTPADYDALISFMAGRTQGDSPAGE